MGRYFGTDGVRGLANSDLSPELALGISGAAARVLIGHDPAHRPVAVVGRDPRASGEMLEAAEALQFEKAALLRDQIRELKHMIEGGKPEEKPRSTSYRKGGRTGRRKARA